MGADSFRVAGIRDRGDTGCRPLSPTLRFASSALRSVLRGTCVRSDRPTDHFRMDLYFTPADYGFTLQSPGGCSSQQALIKLERSNGRMARLFTALSTSNCQYLEHICG